MQLQAYVAFKHQGILNPLHFLKVKYSIRNFRMKFIILCCVTRRKKTKRKLNKQFTLIYEKVLNKHRILDKRANESAEINSLTRYHGGHQFKKRKFNNFNKHNSKSSTCFLCGKHGHKVKDCLDLALVRKWKNCKNFKGKASSNIND